MIILIRKIVLFGDVGYDGNEDGGDHSWVDYGILLYNFKRW